MIDYIPKDPIYRKKFHLKEKIKLLKALSDNELDDDNRILYERELQKAKEELLLIEQCPSCAIKISKRKI